MWEKIGNRVTWSNLPNAKEIIKPLADKAIFRFENDIQITPTFAATPAHPGGSTAVGASPGVFVLEITKDGNCDWRFSEKRLITINPAAVLPWEEMVGVMVKRGVTWVTIVTNSSRPSVVLM